MGKSGMNVVGLGACCAAYATSHFTLHTSHFTLHTSHFTQVNLHCIATTACQLNVKAGPQHIRAFSPPHPLSSLQPFLTGFESVLSLSLPFPATLFAAMRSS